MERIRGRLSGTVSYSGNDVAQSQAAEMREENAHRWDDPDYWLVKVTGIPYPVAIFCNKEDAEAWQMTLHECGEIGVSIERVREQPDLSKQRPQHGWEQLHAKNIPQC